MTVKSITMSGSSSVTVTADVSVTGTFTSNGAGSIYAQPVTMVTYLCSLFREI